MSTVQILLVTALVIYMIGRRFAGQPVGARGMLLPVGLTLYGLVNLNKSVHGQLTTADVVLLAAELVVALVAGLGRGATIKLYLRDGHLWQRYSLLTLFVWLVLVACRIGFAAAGHALGADLPATATVMATFGISIIVETLVVAKRAAGTGAPLLPPPVRGRGGRLTGVR